MSIETNEEFRPKIVHSAVTGVVTQVQTCRKQRLSYR